MKVAVFSNRSADYDQDNIEEAIAFIFESLEVENVVRPGDVVVLKPNWIRQSHRDNPQEWESVITHPAVITSVLNHVLTSLNGTGRAIITDGPQTDSSWEEIMARMTPELWRTMGKKSGVEVELMDLRDHEWVCRRGFVAKRKERSGDPKGTTVVDLADKSEFTNHRPSDMGYYGADYNHKETNSVHNDRHNKYKVSKTVIEADLFINLPKLKTHKKTGITCSLKNLVGINTYKNWLPHYTLGVPERGGDQFAQSGIENRSEVFLMSKIKNLLYQSPGIGRVFPPLIGLGSRIFGRTDEVVRSGNWFGNNTIWRTVLDLNKILFYANADGSMRNFSRTNAKRYLSIVDGIVGGEGDGPLAPDRIESGVLIGGFNPVAVDCVCAKIMGFDYTKIPIVYKAFEIRHFPLADFAYESIEVISNNHRFHGPLVQLGKKDMLAFKPHFGWKGHIELEIE